MNTQPYTSGQIDAFLLSYQIFVDDLAETALEWETLDAEQRSDIQADLLPVWSNRTKLGALFQAGQLTSSQENRLATCDRQLLEQVAAMKQCFDFDLSHLLALFRWGTPLAQSTQPLHLEVEPMVLNRIAVAFAFSPTDQTAAPLSAFV